MGSDAKLCYFVDLFVRVSNSIAIGFYKKLGYTVYRTVLQYYSGENDEDAYDMRKALTIDVDKKSVFPAAKSSPHGGSRILIEGGFFENMNLYLKCALALLFMFWKPSQ